jgi:hypothetical protein
MLAEIAMAVATAAAWVGLTAVVVTWEPIQRWVLKGRGEGGRKARR